MFHRHERSRIDSTRVLSIRMGRDLVFEQSCSTVSKDQLAIRTLLRISRESSRGSGYRRHTFCKALII